MRGGGADSQHLPNFYSDHQWIYIDYFIRILDRIRLYTVGSYYN